MVKLTKEHIRQIADEVDLGFICYYNVKTNEIYSLPDFDRGFYYEEELWKDEIKKIKSQLKYCITFENMSSEQSFEIMEDFAHSVEDEAIKERLLKILDRAKPFRNFKYEIDDYPDLREKWFKFKSDRICKYIEEVIEYFNDSDEYEKMKKYLKK
ncbi:MAG: hypothetical protein JW917_04535 [Ignavibacteria bacterium]|nr:hypothetical protein [Ignavibacteria bacterium]